MTKKQQLKQELQELYRQKLLGFSYTEAKAIQPSNKEYLSNDYDSLKKSVSTCHLCNLSKSRKKEIAKARQVIMFLLREELDLPYLTIGEKIGQRDHTTIIYAYEKIKKELQRSPILEEEINLIKEKLYRG